MSYSDGIAAINLEMPDRVPRTEYSADFHWDLIKTVTGIDVNSKTPIHQQQKATEEFIKLWNYDLMWNILIYNEIFGDICTKMGHANYMADGVDFNDETNLAFKSPEDVLAFEPYELYGEINKNSVKNDFERNYELMCRRFPDLVNMTGIYVTCISGFIELFGWEMLLTAAGTDPEKFGEVSNRYTDWLKQYFEALAESNVPVVMIHDDIVWSAGAFIHPDWYRKYVFPNYKKMFQPLVESKKKILYTSDGDYTIFIDDIVECGVNGFILEPMTDMSYVAEKYGKTHVFIGNADTRILLNGTKEEIRLEVERCMDIGKKYPGFFMAVGNHIPPNTPVENAIYYNEVYEELSRR
jgi:hypothetical protein